MKKIVLFISFVVMCFHSNSQLIFQKTFTAPGNQNAIAAMQSVSDDYYILSETDSGQNNSKDFLLLKLDVSGNLIWSKYFGTTADDIPTDVKEMSNGKIMLCGYTNLNGALNTDILLINIDTAGAVLWSKTYGGAQDDYGNKIAATSDSSVAVAGQTYSYGISTSSGYVLKISSGGNIVWSVTTSGMGTNNTSLKSIDNTFDGGFIVTGYWRSGGGYNYVPVIKLDAFGNVVSGVGILGGAEYFGYDIKAIPGGDFIIVGKLKISAADTGSVLVARANPQTLSATFVKNFYTSSFEAANGVVVTPDANFAVIGTQLNNNGFYTTETGFLTKLNLSGNALFSNEYKPPVNNSSINSIIVTHDNNLFMVGSVRPGNGNSRSIYTIKAQLTTGLSGCNDSNFVYSPSSPNHNLSAGLNNNFGGIAASVTISDSSANVLQNDLCTGVGYQELNNDISVKSVFPNPSFGNLTILFNDRPSEKSIRIFDVTGNIIYKKEKINSAEQQINLTLQSKGIYFLKIIDKNKITVEKIVIQ